MITPELRESNNSPSLENYLAQNPARIHAEVIKSLRNDPSAIAIGLKIQPPQKDNSLRRTIKRALEEKRITEDNKEFIRTFLQFIEGPIITDNFDKKYGKTAHTQNRRAWRNEMLAKYKKDFELFYQTNKLRRNQLSQVVMIITTLHFIDDAIFKDLVEEASQLLESISQRVGYDNYDQLSTDGKLQKVAEADSLARKAIQELIK